jgi:hypothetical protein
MTLDNLDGQNFAGVPEAAEILGGCDPRTVRAEIRAGRIPAIRIGTRWMVPVVWLREQVLGGSESAQPTATDLDVDQLADRIADRLLARLAGAFSAIAPESSVAGPAPPGPAATTVDLTNPLLDGRKPYAHNSPAA